MRSCDVRKFGNGENYFRKCTLKADDVRLALKVFPTILNHGKNLYKSGKHCDQFIKEFELIKKSRKFLNALKVQCFNFGKIQLERQM